MGKKAAEGAKKTLSNAGPGGQGGVEAARRRRRTRTAAVAAARRRGVCRSSAGPTSLPRSTTSTRRGRSSTSSRASCTASSTSSRRGKTRSAGQEKIWFSSRQWEGRVTERRKNDRIVWKTTSGMSHKGVVSFHKLAPTPHARDGHYGVRAQRDGREDGLRAPLREARRAGRSRALQGVRRDGGGEGHRVPAESRGRRETRTTTSSSDADEPTSRDAEVRRRARARAQGAREGAGRSGASPAAAAAEAFPNRQQEEQAAPWL